MKNFKMICLLVLALFTMCIFVSCGDTKNSRKQVYIIQYVSATALDNATEGIIEGLKEQGYVDGENCDITIYNPQTKSDTMADMVEKAVRRADVIFAIATPVAQAVAAQTEKKGSNVPVLFTAVTDPVVSGIITDNTHPGGNVSGTSDINPVADQVALLKEINPEATKLGFIYTTGEKNSEIQLEMAKEECAKLGISVEASSVTNSDDIEPVLNALFNKGIDALYIPTDNDIASQMQFVSNKCNQNGIITICGEVNQLTDGGIITVGSVDYTELGKMTGVMGAKALNGADVGAMPVEYYSSTDLVINKSLVTQYSLAIPQTLLDKAKDFTN